MWERDRPLENAEVNIILILIDSLNRSALPSYGPTRVATPNLDAFAQRSVRFDNHFVGSLPCIPARRELIAGFKEVMWRPWGPLEPTDSRLPALLEESGYTTALVTDHHHYWSEAANGYMQSFQSITQIRGHEADAVEPPVADDENVPRWVRNIGNWRWPAAGMGYYANVRHFTHEEDFFPAKVFTRAATWIRDHAARSPFYLQIESFDPHEPFHVPEPYASMYGDASGYDRFTIWPPYQNPRRMREFLAAAAPEEIDFIRAQYHGKVTMTDRWFGEVLQVLDQLSLWDDTMVIVTSDHGHDLVEHDSIGKQHPHYDSHANIPLWIWHPHYCGTTTAVNALTSTVDLFSTVLDAANTPIPERTHGHSLMPLISGNASSVQSSVLYGSFGNGLCCTDGDWTIIKAPDHDGPLYSYSTLQFRSLTYDNLALPVGAAFFIPGVDLPQWQVPLHDRFPITTAMHSRENLLFNRRDDPRQTRNLWDDQPAQRQRMLGVMRDLMVSEGAPLEQYERLGVPL